MIVHNAGTFYLQCDITGCATKAGTNQVFIEDGACYPGWVKREFILPGRGWHAETVPLVVEPEEVDA